MPPTCLLPPSIFTRPGTQPSRAWTALAAAGPLTFLAALLYTLATVTEQRPNTTLLLLAVSAFPICLIASSYGASGQTNRARRRIHTSILAQLDQHHQATLADPAELAVLPTEPGQTAPITLLRNGQRCDVMLTLPPSGRIQLHPNS